MNNEPGKRRKNYTQASLFSELLKADSNRNWSALTPAWIHWMYSENECIQANYADIDSFSAYCYQFINGYKQFPWPREYSDAERMKHTADLRKRTIQWVKKDHPERVAVVLGNTEGLVDGSTFTINSFLKKSLKLSGFTGNVSQMISDAMADNKLDTFEADEIINSCNKAIHEFQQTVQTIKNHMKERGNHE